jgi:hypothetical protein
MKKYLYILSGLMLIMAASLIAETSGRDSHSQYVVVTASNSDNNTLLVYDANGVLIQAVPTGQTGGVSGNAGGVARDESSHLVAIVNIESQSVAVFKQGTKHHANYFELIQIIPTLSPPVSVAFGNNHLYILGLTTVESHLIEEGYVAFPADGIAELIVGNGSATQVGVIEDQLIITEKTNTVEVAELNNGALTGIIIPVILPVPLNTDTPFGLATRGEKAYISFSTGDEVALVKHNQVLAVATTLGQQAPSWLALIGKFLYSSNAASHSISLFKVSGNTITLLQPVAALTVGAPIDIASEGNTLALLNNAPDVTLLNQYLADRHGNLTLLNSVPTVTGANGVAIVPLHSLGFHH